MSNCSVTDLLDVFERVNRTHSIGEPALDARARVRHHARQHRARARRWGSRWRARRRDARGGEDAAAPIQDSGIVWGLGTDATIVSHYQPFVTLGWIVSGLDLAGRRVLDETVTREQALIAHTRSNAYLFFQEDELGSLEVGKQRGPRRARPRLPDRAGRRDQGHPADADDGRRARRVRARRAMTRRLRSCRARDCRWSRRGGASLARAVRSRHEDRARRDDHGGRVAQPARVLRGHGPQRGRRRRNVDVRGALDPRFLEARLAARHARGR